MPSSPPNYVPLNVEGDDFIAAMNKVIALVKERRRRLSETPSVSLHASSSNYHFINNSRTCSRSTSASRGERTPHRVDGCGDAAAGSIGDNTNTNALRTHSSGAAGRTASGGLHLYDLGRAALPATGGHTEEALAQTKEIRDRHTHQKSSSTTATTPPTNATTIDRTASVASSPNPRSFTRESPASNCGHSHSQHAIDRLPHRHPYAPILVAVAGAAGSGKTTAAKHIIDYLKKANTFHKLINAEDNTSKGYKAKSNAAEGESGGAQENGSHSTRTQLGTSTPIAATAVSLDGYHRYRSELEAMDDPDLAAARRGAAFTFNPSLYERDLLFLLDRAWVKFPSFEHHIKDPVEEDILVDCRPRRLRPQQQTPTKNTKACNTEDAKAEKRATAEERLKTNKEEVERDGVRGVIDFGTEVVVVEGLYTLFTGEELMRNDGLYNPNRTKSLPASLSASQPLAQHTKPIPFPMPDKERKAWAAAAKLFDLKIFVECDLSLATERLVRRHMAAWGIPREEAFIRASGSDYDNSVVVQRTARNADAVLRSVEWRSV